VLSRLVLYALLLVLGVKAFFRVKWREIGRRLDRLVNVTLIAIAIVYSLQLLWWLVFVR
jgi:hypothetical protein